MFTIGGVGGILGALLAPILVERYRVGTIFVLATAIPLLAIPLMAGAVSPWMIVIGWAIIDLTIPAYNVAQVTYRVSLVPDEFQGRVSSIFRLLIFSGMLIGTSLGGICLEWFGARPVLWGTFAGMFVITLGVLGSGLRKA